MLDRLFLELILKEMMRYLWKSRLEDNMNIEEIAEDEVKRAVDRSRNGKAPAPPYDLYDNSGLTGSWRPSGELSH